MRCIFGLIFLVSYAYGLALPTCPSNIYCHGPLLDVVQKASLYPDSKTFVDMKMKYSPEETLFRFQKMMNATGSKPSRDDVEKFVNEAFDDPGSEMDIWEPKDWKKHPKFLDKIADPALKEWGKDLNDLWKLLGRKIKDEVAENPEHYSIIYVPNPVIVPGGRFREFYYWDSYWIVRGLLLSEMYDTVKGMLINFCTIVDKYGFIPNGGRIYYAMRSQPPMLIPMVETYVKTTNDFDFVKKNIHTLEAEFNFWMVNRTVQIPKGGKTYNLAVYQENSSGPRPESYREDIHSASTFKTQQEKEDHYSELKAAAESGWDFSTRWFVLNATNKGNLTNLKTRSIVPVDLNSILYWNAKILSDFYTMLNMPEKAKKYSAIAEEWLEAVDAILWHEEVGAWLDYDRHNEIKRDYFYPTNIAPLWTGCYRFTNMNQKVAKILNYLKKTQVMVNEGGIPSTLEHSGEQWDYPNAWPPLQHIMAVGLDNTGDPWAKKLAYEITERWVRSNFKAYNETHAMYEKYDATIPGGHGGGGEYQIQLGFGWTNGVIMDMLWKYGDELTVEDGFESFERSKAATPIAGSSMEPMGTVLLALFVTFAAGCIGIIYYKRRNEYDHRSLCPKLFGGYDELRTQAFE
ncbi:trehalase isoform X1 [Ischnura elegans]|uniref:trehalase isoform X1 n=2 Tax=Ischnura elegans TaxID=197161 RepID=UPI001ED8B53D|nr:trehalase isoform X1 [Ischnura elegans]